MVPLYGVSVSMFFTRNSSCAFPHPSFSLLHTAFGLTTRFHRRYKLEIKRAADLPVFCDLAYVEYDFFGETFTTEGASSSSSLLCLLLVHVCVCTCTSLVHLCGLFNLGLLTLCRCRILVRNAAVQQTTYSPIFDYVKVHPLSHPYLAPISSLPSPYLIPT